uniref:Uncharacterized protein n=1 Tax=Parascaris univalens TaxID=6257 RepID=A0A915CHF7_PARUN
MASCFTVPVCPFETIFPGFSPECGEKDSREWRQIIGQQRLPNAGDTSGKNRMDADSKFRIVQSSAGSLEESLLT